MDHNGFERQTRRFPATIKTSWCNVLESKVIQMDWRNLHFNDYIN